MNTRFRLYTLLLWGILIFGTYAARAQWLTQNFDLKAGWNAVFLHVDASHASIGTLLGSNPDGSIEEIWLWKPEVSTQQFVQNPQQPTSVGSQWLNWTRTLGNASPLQKLIPNAAYLVRVRSQIATYQWQLKGKPVVPRYQWTTTGLNFFGFPTIAAQPPSFDEFLAQAPSEFQRTAEIYRYPGGDLGAGNPARVFALRNTRVHRGEAYWIRAGEIYNRYYGPFEVVSAGVGIVTFGDSLGTFSLRLRNPTANSITVTLRLAASEAPPTNQPDIVAVPPLLIRGDVNPTNLTYKYSSLPVGTPKSWTLAPYGQDGSDQELVLGLDRSVMNGNAGEVLAGLLQFTDSLGQSQVDIGVSAKVGSNAGLWVGGAAVTQVGQYLKSYARDAANNPIVSTNGHYVVVSTNTSLGDVPATYPLRLIVHSPSAGVAKLFQRIFFGYNGATNPVLANQEVSLNRNLLGQARRISASHLPFTEGNSGWAFSGLLAKRGSVTTSVTNEFNNQTSNPFLHTYHPDHDNLDVRFQKELPQGSESYTIIRDIKLSVTSLSDDFASRTGAGQILNGNYEESVRLLGLARAGNTFTNAYNGSTADKVGGYPALLFGGAEYTADAGGATGKAGDKAIDLTLKGGPVATYDKKFLAAANDATSKDELSVSFWQKNLNTAESSAFTLNSPSAGISRGFHAHVPWSNQNVYFDTVGCCDGKTQRITADINTFEDYTTGDPRDNLWWTTKWHHWVFTKKGSQKNIYIDGKLFLKGDSTNPLRTDHNAFYMGSDSNGGHMAKAIIDDYAVFGKELTLADAAALKGGTLPSALPAAKGLIAYWDFNDDAASAAIVSATRHTRTLQVRGIFTLNRISDVATVTQTP